MCSDKLVASCRLRWCPSHTIPVPHDSQYMHHPSLLLPAVTALQQGSDGLPEFTYKPVQGENDTLKLSAGQEEHRRFQDQHLEPLTQLVQTVLIHQHSLCV